MLFYSRLTDLKTYQILIQWLELESCYESGETNQYLFIVLTSLQDVVLTHISVVVTSPKLTLMATLTGLVGHI